jgi:hypothetical protein
MSPHILSEGEYRVQRISNGTYDSFSYDGWGGSVLKNSEQHLAVFDRAVRIFF